MNKVEKVRSSKMYFASYMPDLPTSIDMLVGNMIKC